ncbi:MAG: DUF3833 family protein [Stappiaceae bacterium]
MRAPVARGGLIAKFFFILTLWALNPASASAEDFVLERYFQGKTKASGVFRSWIAGVNRPFTVITTGSWDGKTLELREDFVFEDGERDRKTWFFEKIAEGEYLGTRADVEGKAHLRTFGNKIRFSYVADVKNGDKTTKLRFSDTLSLQKDGTVLNTARVSKFGIPIGKVELTFVK